MTLQGGPCVICGDVNYELSIGGPNICPSCDCGNFGPDVVRRLGNTLVDLRNRLVLAERLVRVDAATTAQLSKSIALNARFRECLRASLHALEMVRDANRDSPHIPSIALDTIEKAIFTSEELLRWQE